MAVEPSAPMGPTRPRRLRRPLLWAALVALLVVAQSALVVLTLRFEEARVQDRTDDAAAAIASDIKRRAQLLLQGLQTLSVRPVSAQAWQGEAGELLRERRELGRIERRDRNARIVEATDSAFRTPLFRDWPRAELAVETELACAAAQRTMLPVFSRSQFVPLAGGLGVEVIDVCVPQQDAGRHVGFVVGTVVLTALLEEARPAELMRQHEVSFVEADGARLARIGTHRGAGVFVAERIVDLAGNSLQIRVDALERRPGLIPNLAVALVLGLSLGLFAVVVLLVRDGRRRARAESALAEALAFAKAMEDSLITGVRARDRQGGFVHANAAFRTMVGFSTDELRDSAVPPYWPPEQVSTYQQRQAERLSPSQRSELAREGYETVFMRKDGERFPVMVYDAPLVDSAGQHTGWMSTVLDVSAQRRMEELSRQQQERLQATARLASVGEMASLLSHELNQPLSAIASYATGSINLMQRALADQAVASDLARAASARLPSAAASGAASGSPAPDDTPQQLLHAMGRIAEQAERAGRVIKSVHDFVRRRQQAHELIGADVLIESVLPLVRLQARKSGARIEVDVPRPAPRVRVDRTMVEQVLLNLARNGLQAMETDTALPQRVLTLRVQQQPDRWVAFHVIDAGTGISVEVAQRLFTPFFTTRDEGMGLGLSLCRTVVEQHGGAIDFENLTPAGTLFRFTLPLDASYES